MVNASPPPPLTLAGSCTALIARFLQLSWVRFGLVGVLNTITGLSIIYLLKWAFSVPDFPANLGGYGVGLIVSYILNSRWTFASKRPVASSLPRFAIVILVSYVINYAIVALALKSNVNSYVAQAMGVLPYSLSTYFGSRFFVFHHSPASEV
jgi:putative flippase GtrA